MALQHVRCGEIDALFDDRDAHLRHIRFGGVEVLRGIYAAVRDRNWGTVAPALTDLSIERGQDRISLRFKVACGAPGIDFVWQGEIDIDAAAGRIEYRFDGRSRAAFLKNRIGFCVLHPASCGGRDVIAETVDGASFASRFPELISPHQPFKNLRALTHFPAPGIETRVEMHGDTFEMEDQRNWTDASFKTYCTPLDLPFPVEIPAGAPVRQAIRVFVSAKARSAPSRATGPADAVTLSLSAGAPVPLPDIGFGASPTGDYGQLLTGLRPAHLRVDLDGAPATWRSKLANAWREAQAAGAGLEIALHLTPPAARDELGTIRALVEERGVASAVVRWLVFCAGEKSTSAAWIEAARHALHEVTPSARFVGGTNAYFTEVNRGRPSAPACDGVAFSVNPQVHAFDDLSLVETLPMQAEVVRNARAFSTPELPVFVSPVTLRMRFNADATSADAAPPPPDPRQRTVVGALWTVGSIKYIAEAGATGVTYYLSGGEAGLGTDGPEGRFPVWAVFRAVADFAGGRVVPLVSSDPLRADAMLLEVGGRRRLLLANYADAPARIDAAAVVPARVPPTVLIGEGHSPLIGESVAPPLSILQWDW